MALLMGPLSASPAVKGAAVRGFAARESSVYPKAVSVMLVVALAEERPLSASKRRGAAASAGSVSLVAKG